MFILMFPVFSSCSQIKMREDPLLQKNREGKEIPPDILICGAGPAAHPGDWGRWKNYLIKNLVLDSASVDTIPAGTYKAIVQFVIDTDGKLKDIGIVTDPGYGLGARVKKVISKYKDKWIPEQFDWRPTVSYHRQPVIFIVEEEEKPEVKSSSGSIL